MPRQTRDPGLLAAALVGLEARKAHLERQIEKVRRMLGPAGSPRKAAASVPGTRRLSAEGRKRIAEAARKRWAEFRKRKAKS